MYEITISGVIHRIRRRLDVDAIFLPDNDALEYVASSCAELQEEVAHAEPLRYYSSANITVTAGTPTYQLPADYFQMQSVLVEDSSAQDGFSPLGMANYNDRYPTSHCGVDKLSTGWLIRGADTLELVPTPVWSGTVRVEYNPTTSGVFQLSDTFNFINGWHEFVVNDVCAKIRGGEEELSAKAFILERDRALKRVIKNSRVSKNQPRHVKTHRKNALFRYPFHTRYRGG